MLQGGEVRPKKGVSAHEKSIRGIGRESKALTFRVFSAQTASQGE